jgi:hypothetical protein
MFYCHPWEIDPSQPRMPFGRPLSRFRHYVNLATTQQKLKRLLKEFVFGPIDRVLSQAATSSAIQSAVPAV